MQFPHPKEGGGWWCWGGTWRGQGQQDPVWQNLVAQGGGPRQLGTRVTWVWFLWPRPWQDWEGLGKEQGPEWVRPGGGLVTESSWWWDEIVVEWDCGEVAQ